MFYPSLKDFLKLSKSANVIPVYKQINADLETPVSAFLKIDQGNHAFLLESVEGQEKTARYSFLGSNPSLIFKSKARNIEIIYPHEQKVKKFITSTDPLEEIKKIMRPFKPAHIKGLPRFCGGLVGYIGYDAVRFFEEIPDKNFDDLKLADFYFMLTDTLLVFDHVNHTIKIISNCLLPQKMRPLSKKERISCYHKAISKIEKIEKDFVKSSGKEMEAGTGKIKTKQIKSNYQKNEFENIVKQAKKYINKGDIIQAVLSQRFEIKLQKKPFDIFRTLRSINPSPYMFYLKLNDMILIGSSPEMLVRCEDNIVRTRPIAGTRPRGKDEQEDKKLEKELLADKKEKAEHIMLVDLGRNDLGRVCCSGSVKLNEFMSVERYSHVMHLVSEVTGKLSPKYDVYDVMRASFPAGTVSGSPKIRAMQIIDELESCRRGPYAGCVGYFSFLQNMDTCITIRTILVKGNTAYIQAGAGIVADSVPEREYFESVNKARALMEAITK